MADPTAHEYALPYCGVPPNRHRAILQPTIDALLERAGGGVFGQAAIAMFDTQDFDPGFEERESGGRDDRVRGRRRPTSEQNGNTFDVCGMMIRHGGEAVSG